MIQGTLSKTWRVLRARWHVLILIWVLGFIPPVAYYQLSQMGLVPSLYSLGEMIYVRESISDASSNIWLFWIQRALHSGVLHIISSVLLGWATALKTGAMIIVVTSALYQKREGTVTRKIFGALFPLWGYFIILAPLMGFAVQFALPGLWLKTIWLVAFVAAGIEGKHPIAAAKRSQSLTKGHRWQVSVFAIFFFVLNFAFGYFAPLLVSMKVIPLVENVFVYITLARRFLFSLLSFVSVIIAICAYWHLREMKGELPETTLAATFS